MSLGHVGRNYHLKDLKDSTADTTKQHTSKMLIQTHNLVVGQRRGARPRSLSRDWYFIAEQPAPAPHLARPKGRAALTHMWLLSTVCTAPPQILQFYVFFMEKRMKGDWTKTSRRAHFWGFAVSNYGVAFWAFFLFVVGAHSTE